MISAGRPALDLNPGVAATGHMTSRGFWHPGLAANCAKPGCCQSGDR